MLIAASPLSLAAAGLYVLVAIATGSAATLARVRNQQAWHWRGWAWLAVLFLLLFVSRVLDVEDMLRDQLRENLRANAAYDERTAFQRPLVAGLLVVATACGLWLAHRTAQTIRGRRNIALAVAIGASLAMLLLIALRMISLHAVDALLYGALKLNWFADVGLSCLIGGAAIHYFRLVRKLL